MDSNCRKLGETPYRECRKQAAIYNDALGSMERAAEMLGVSVNTLSNYELGVTVPPVDIIIVMADLYRAPQLKTMYCKNECLIGRCMPVAVEAGSIDNIVIRIIKQFKESRIEGLKDKLIGIAEDGKVSEEEELLMPYIEDPTEPTKAVYPYVPVEVVEQVIEKHGGWFDARIPFA